MSSVDSGVGRGSEGSSLGLAVDDDAIGVHLIFHHLLSVIRVGLRLGLARTLVIQALLLENLHNQQVVLLRLLLARSDLLAALAVLD